MFDSRGRRTHAPHDSVTRRRIRGLAEEERRRDALLNEPPRNIAQQEPTDAMTVNPPQHVDLVQFARETRHSAIVSRPLRKTKQLASVILNDEAKPAAIGDRKCLPPLTLSQFIRRASFQSAAMRFVERLHVQPC